MVRSTDSVVVESGWLGIRIIWKPAEKEISLKATQLLFVNAAIIL